jgi:hypothetical protein
LKLTKTLKVLIIEVGMLGGILVALYTVPGNTPLKTFLIASAGVFLLGNVLLMRGFRSKQHAEGSGRRAWFHILRACAILAACWLLILLFRHA